MMNYRTLTVLTLSLLLLCTAVTITGCAKTPSIESVSPSREEPGKQVVIKGKNFGDTRGNGLVTFDGDHEARVISWSDTAITCMVPEGLKTGQSQIVVTNNGGRKSNIRLMNIEEPEIKKIKDDIEIENTTNRVDDAGDGQQTTPGTIPVNNQATETGECKSAMISYAGKNSEPGVEFTITRFWMNDEFTEAEAVIEGIYSTGPNAGQPLESAGITAVKEGESWVVTDFGTGIDLKHL